MDKVCVVTGATGLVGSHVVEELCAHGVRVRALVRATSDTQWLQTLPVECVTADLHELSRQPHVLDNVDAVYHCAAFVREWGTWEEFRKGTVETTRQLVEACRRASVGRLVHVSSISVFGNPPESAGEISEGTPTGRHLWPGDYYGQSKIEAEDVIRTYDNHTLIRPSWIYGRRDLVSLPRVIDALRSRRARIIGSGENDLNLVSAKDVARGIVLAGNSPQAAGQAYHLCSLGEITQREFFDFLSRRLNLPAAGGRVPIRLAWRAASTLEAVYRMLGRRVPPPVTRRALLMLSRSTHFSIAKARRDLGWRPEVAVRVGLEDAVRWYAENLQSAARSQS